MLNKLFKSSMQEISKKLKKQILIIRLWFATIEEIFGQLFKKERDLKEQLIAINEVRFRNFSRPGHEQIFLLPEIFRVVI